jgi:hypothetical protein
VTWQLANEPNAVRRLVRKLEREAPGPVRAFYEAGPCGYALQRQVTTSRVSCDVVAPALIPRKPSERVKTNRRDARKLVELGRAGLLTAVQPPTPEDEAVRDLARARDDAREDLQRCRHRLSITSYSNKSRLFNSTADYANEAAILDQVAADTREALSKYSGVRTSAAAAGAASRTRLPRTPTNHFRCSAGT